MSSYSVSNFLRSYVADYFVQKPEAGASDEARKIYYQNKNVFVYNTTAKIANAAAITAVVTAAATMLSMVSLFFATLIIGASLALHLHATQSLPQIKNSGTDAAPYMEVFGTNSTARLIMRSASRHFGITTDQFYSDDKAWKQFACVVAGHGIWANTLPTNPRARSESSSVSSVPAESV